MRLLNVSEMKLLEEAANAAGYSYTEMMQNAGIGIAHKVQSHYGVNGSNIAVGLIGGGNNGGDTLVALTELVRTGWQCSVLLTRERKGDDPLLKQFIENGGRQIKVGDLDPVKFREIKNGILLDGVYGTGFHLPMAKQDEQILKLASEKMSSFIVIAVDCPSGVDCQTGEVAPGTIKADLTICLEAVKTGLITPSAFSYCGEIEAVDLGLARFNPKPASDMDMVAGLEDVRELIPVRERFSHKGTFGKVIIAGGSVNYSGAPILAGRSAYAVGTGLVQIAVPEPVYMSAAASTLESTWLILEDEDGVISENAVDTLADHASQAQCLLIGPGMGREETTGRFIARLLLTPPENGKTAAAGFIGVGNGRAKKEAKKIPPLVIDADALVLMAKEANWQQKLRAEAVLTPHPGEMAALTGLSIDEIQAQRIEIARKYAQQWKQTVVLKGALTVVAGKNGRVAIIPVATSALAKAGTGDVLSGMIGGLMAQGLTPWNAAVAGAWMHAQAGLTASKRVGCDESVLAADVIQSIPEVYKRISSRK